MRQKGSPAAAHAGIVQLLQPGDRQGPLLHQTARDHGPEGQLVFRIAQELQQGHALDHQGMGGQQQAVLRDDGDTGGGQIFGHQRGLGVAAHQHQHVLPGAARGQFVQDHAAQAHQHGGIEPLAVVAFDGFHAHEAAGSGPGREVLGRPGIARGHASRIAVQQVVRRVLRHQGGKGLPGHGGILQGREQGVVVRDDLAAAAPVGRERLVAHVRGQTAQGPFDAVKEGRIPATPAVDGLLDVAHPGQGTAPGKGLFHQRAQGLPLFAAGILELVQQEILQAAAQTAQGLGDAEAAAEHRSGQLRHQDGGQRALLLLVGPHGVDQQGGQLDGRSEMAGRTQQGMPASELRQPGDQRLQGRHQGFRAFRFGREESVDPGLGDGLELEGPFIPLLEAHQGLAARGMESGPGAFFRLQHVRDQTDGPVPVLPVAFAQLFRARDVREFAAQDAVQQGADDVAQLFPGIEALALLHMNDGPVEVAQQLLHGLVALGCLVEQGLEIGGHGVHAHEGGLEVRGQVQLQGGRTHDGVEQAVDGADVEAGQIPQDDLQPAGGHAGRQGDVLFRRAQGDGLEPSDDAVAHLAGSGIGEGDGQDLVPAGGTAAQPAGRCGGGPRRAAGRQQAQKTPGQVIGLARPGGCLDLIQASHASPAGAACRPACPVPWIPGRRARGRSRC